MSASGSTTTSAEASGSEASGESDGSSSSTGTPEPFCGDGNVDPDEECDDGNDFDFDGCLSDCTPVELLEPTPMEWEFVEIEGTRCLNGSTAGFGINYNPDSTNLMIYLEGGGACFNDACDFTAFELPFTGPDDGIFSRSNDDNPVRDWSMIYVPYCTGDIHAGDGQAELGGELRQFRGYSNVTRYLQRVVPSFDTERVLLTGISAGGFGAAINATQVADAYGEDVEITVVDDSGPPASNDVIAPCLQDLFRETWNLDATALAQCPTCDPNNFASDLLAYTVENYPNLRFGLYSNTGDAIIRGYMGFGWGNGDFDNCGGVPTPVPLDTYRLDLDYIRADYNERISTFYRTGLSHTVLRVGYGITSVDGVSVPEWIGNVLDGDIRHVGP